MREFDYKNDRHITLLEDKESEQIILSHLKAAFPDFNIYAEEDGITNTASAYQWIIDPIEGTTNYGFGLPFYATQIALAKNEQLIWAGVYAPALNLFFEADEERCLLNNERLELKNAKPLARSAIGIGKGTTPEAIEAWKKFLGNILEDARTIRAYGSCGLEICLVAAGILDGYVNFGSFLYDFAPGAFIAKQAGASVSNIKGENWTVKDDTMIVSQPGIHQELINLLRK